MAVQSRHQCESCGFLARAQYRLPMAQPRQLRSDLGNQPNSLLVEELIALLDEPSLVLELELRDAGRDRLPLLVSHALSQDDAQSARASGASVPPPAGPGGVPMRPPCFHRAYVDPAG